jgi:hypothetical protein
MGKPITNMTSITSAGICALGFFFSPSVALAQEEVVCTVVYGQGEVCGVKTPEGEVLGVHEPVEAGIEDLDFFVVSAALGAIGAALFFLSKLTRRIYLFDR